MRAELARKIATHALAAGEHVTAVPGLVLYRRTTPTACNPATYEPSLTVFAQGEKRVTLGGTTYLCDGSKFLLTSVNLPVQSQIISASEKVPLLSLFLRLEMSAIRELFNQEESLPAETNPRNRGLAVGETTVGL